MKTIYEQVKSFSNTRVLNYKCLGSTNTKGSRIKITDKWFKKSITIPYSYEYSTGYENVLAYLINRGWTPAGMNTEYNIIFFEEWDSNQQLK